MRQDHRQRRRGDSTPPILILSLLAQIYEAVGHLPIQPIVTLFLLGVNIAPFFFHDVHIFGYYMNDIHTNCLHPRKIVSALSDGEFLVNRLVLSAFIHADETHLYYNMLSLLWKGINLEIKIGSEGFLKLIVFSLITSHSLLIIMAYLLELCMKESDGSYHTCAVGFSAVLFSLKYVLNHSSLDRTNVMGFYVSSKYAAWLELILISVISPNASFIGHLGGILAGILYVHGLPIFTKLEPQRSQSRGFSSGSSGRNGYGYGESYNGRSYNTAEQEGESSCEEYYYEEFDDDTTPPASTEARAGSERGRCRGGGADAINDTGSPADSSNSWQEIRAQRAELLSKRVWRK